MAGGRPQAQGNEVVSSSFFGMRQTRTDLRTGLTEWLKNFRAGTGRPPWMDQTMGSLSAMLSAAQAEERVAAAIPMIALGQDQKALPVLLASAKAEGAQRAAAAEALPWLPSPQRLDLFRQLRAMDLSQQALLAAINALAVIPDSEAEKALWDVLGERQDLATTGEVLSALRTSYFGSSYGTGSQVRPADRAAIITVAKARVAGGTEMQQVVGLILLLATSPADAAEAGKAVYQETKNSDYLRMDGLAVHLLAQSPADSDKDAVAVLQSGATALRRVALLYLATREESLRTLRETLYLNFDNPSLTTVRYTSSPDGTPMPITPTAPAGLAPDVLRPILGDPDRQQAAYAGYLLSLLHEADGFEPLATYWRENGKTDDATRKLVYRAAAALNDDKLTAVLAEVYASYEKQTYYVREFYWTIRGIQGPQILELRKRIRQEIGMDGLR